MLFLYLQFLARLLATEVFRVSSRSSTRTQLTTLAHPGTLTTASQHLIRPGCAPELWSADHSSNHNQRSIWVQIWFYLLILFSRKVLLRVRRWVHNPVQPCPGPSWTSEQSDLSHCRLLWPNLVGNDHFYPTSHAAYWNSCSYHLSIKRIK